MSGLGGNTGAFLAGGAMALAMGVGAYIGFGSPAQTPQAVVTPQPATAPETTPSDPEIQTASPEVLTTAPSFDTLRRDGDGTTVIAGRAAPLSEVAIVVDGAQVATATADSAGGFAAVTVLPPQPIAQSVTLSSRAPAQEGAAVTSLEEIILAPAPLAPAPPPAAAPARTATVALQDRAPEPPQDTGAQSASTAASAPESGPESGPEAVAVLKSDADGVRLLNAPRPEAMTAVALDTIGYSQTGDVQLSGRAQANSTRVRVYLDNRSVVTLPVDGQGRWQGDLPNVDEGVYTLRVDELRADGAVSSRVETPFRRESAATLAQAAQSDGPVTSVTVQAGATLWAIARERYGDGTLFVRVFEANADSIRDPDLIFPGQVFDLPN